MRPGKPLWCRKLPHSTFHNLLNLLCGKFNIHLRITRVSSTTKRDNLSSRTLDNAVNQRWTMRLTNTGLCGQPTQANAVDRRWTTWLADAGQCGRPTLDYYAINQCWTTRSTNAEQRVDQRWITRLTNTGQSGQPTLDKAVDQR